MVILDDGIGLWMDFSRGFNPVSDRHRRLDIQEMFGLGYADRHFPGGHQFLGPADGLGGNALEDFQAVFGIPADGSESCCDRKTDHACSGDADSHAVFKDVAAHGDLDAEISGLAPKGTVPAVGTVVRNDFDGFGDGEGDGDGFRTAKGRFYLFVDQLDDLSLAFCHSVDCGLNYKCSFFLTEKQ